MAFRDDKDALAERLADLERDLAETREGLRRKDDELRRLRERLGVLDKPRTSRVVPIAIGAAVVVAAAGIWMVTARRAVEPVAHVAPPAVEAPPVVVAPPPPPAVVEPARTADPVVAPPTPSAEITWKATVRSATGTFADLKPGTRCAIDAEVTGGSDLSVRRLAVTCGDAALYDTRAPVRGTMMSQTSSGLEEMKRDGGGFTYRLVYQDVGTRTLQARPQVEIGTARRVARLFHDGALGGAVVMTIDPESQPRTGDALQSGDAP